MGSWLEHFHGPVAYVVCGLLVFGEAAVLLGFVIPGETAALIGGVLASLHHVDLVLMVAVIVVCAIVGDSVGYEVGKWLGPWLVEHRPLRGHPGVRRGQDLLARRGGPAVFLGRWLALARALVPGLAGMSGMRYRTFLAYNAAGGTVWGITFVLIGYAAGTSVRGGGEDGGGVLPGHPRRRGGGGDRHRRRPPPPRPPEVERSGRTGLRPGVSGPVRCDRCPSALLG